MKSGFEHGFCKVETKNSCVVFVQVSSELRESRISAACEGGQILWQKSAAAARSQWKIASETS